jgi:cytochrome c peroxidase
LGATESEKRGRKFFEDIFDPQNLKLGSCAICHSGPMLNRTNQFFPVPPVGGRFQAVGVSEFNEAKNPVRSFVFKQDGIERKVLSPDPGRALISGRVEDVNVFKIPSLWGVRRTAPYFHDNSARTLEELAAHYAKLFEVLIPGNPVILTPQDQADIVAYLKLLE